MNVKEMKEEFIGVYSLYLKEERKWGSYLSIIISKVKEIIKSTLLKMSTDLPLVKSAASVKWESKAWEACPKSISFSLLVRAKDRVLTL